MDWDKLKIFHAVAEAGSFTRATVNLNLSQSAISRQIQSLEQDLKIQLLWWILGRRLLLMQFPKKGNTWVE